jgi:Leucine-rich repeat (LRR) protein
MTFTEIVFDTLTISQCQDSMLTVTSYIDEQYYTIRHISIVNSPALTKIRFLSLPDVITLHTENINVADLDISMLRNLEKLSCTYSGIESLYVANLKLVDLDCSHNKLTMLILNKELQTLDCSYNQLVDIEINNLHKLTTLNCSHNNLPNIKISNCINLHTLTCNNNNLEDISYDNLPALQILNCDNSKLTHLYLYNVSNLQYLDCADNYIDILNIKHLLSLKFLNCTNCNLKEIIFPQHIIKNLSLYVTDNIDLKLSTLSNEQILHLRNLTDNQLHIVNSIDKLSIYSYTSNTV